MDDFTILDHFPHIKKIKKGEVGIEIEIEGPRVWPFQDERDEGDPMKYWRPVGDNSLRGESCEYVVKTPVVREEVGKAITELNDFLQDRGAEPIDSDRCGVHVHINMQDLTLRQFVVFTCLYLIVEDILVRSCGEDREGNFFCLRARDAEGLIDALMNAYASRNLHMLQSDEYRYSAVNVSALGKYGSLEFRAMRTPLDLFEIETWVNLLLTLKDNSFKFNEPYDIIENFSREGEYHFFSMVMGDNNAYRMWKEGDAALMMSAVRRVQDIVYADTEAKAFEKYRKKEMEEQHKKFVEDRERLKREGFNIDNVLREGRLVPELMHPVGVGHNHPQDIEEWPMEAEGFEEEPDIPEDEDDLEDDEEEEEDDDLEW